MSELQSTDDPIIVLKKRRGGSMIRVNVDALSASMTPQELMRIMEQTGYMMMDRNGVQGLQGSDYDTDKTDTSQGSLQGDDDLQKGEASSYDAAYQAAVRALVDYGSAYRIDIEGAGNGYRWRLVDSTRKVELPRGKEDDVEHRVIDGYHIKVKRGRMFDALQQDSDLPPAGGIPTKYFTSALQQDFIDKYGSMNFLEEREKLGRMPMTRSEEKEELEAALWGNNRSRGSLTSEDLPLYHQRVGRI